jgi:hypothetical protein
VLTKAISVDYSSTVYKTCGHCKINKPVSEFSKDNHQDDGLNNKCRACCKEAWQAFSSRKYGAKPFAENKQCSQYLGIHVAERLLRHLFKDVQTMPLHNHGYDFICNRGFKVDAKSSVAYHRTKNGKQWQFNIEHNIIADYFLCLAFDNREDLNPVHLWLIPGSSLNHLQTASVGENTISKWSQYERPIDGVLSCCNAMKEEAVT